MHAPVPPTPRHFGWRLSAIIASLSMLAPFSIDTYLPSFPDIAREFAVAPLVLQQTLSFYLLAFAVMMLVYGPLSDAFGRKPVVLVALAVYVLSSVGCALAPSAHWLLLMRVGQGMSAAAGIVIGRAVIRDAFAGARAQRVMAQVYLIFAVAPAIAPIVGGWLHDLYGWRSVFWFLTLLGVGVFLWVVRGLPETLPPVGRQSAHPRSIGTSYIRALRAPRFMLLILSVALNFGGFFIYVAASPDVVYRHLGYQPDDFGYLFVPLVAGLMAGAFLSGRMAGRLSHAQAAMAGYGLMLTAAALNLVLALLPGHNAVTIVAPLMLYACGMSLTMPNLSLLALEVFPSHKGLASAVQGFSHAGFNAVIAGAIAPLLSHRLDAMAAGLLGLNLTAFAVWLAWRRRFGETVP